jgi:signal peptidase I
LKTWLFGICGIAIVLFLWLGAPKLAFVYAKSMEPTIMKNDGFIIGKAHTYQVGDIIVYRPTVLHVAYVTHRIIRMTNAGFVTKGDNAPSSDQESGEPIVKSGQVVGKALTVHGQPITLPRLGLLKNKAITVPIVVILGIGGVWLTRRRRRPRRFRRQSLYAQLSVIALITLFVIFFYKPQTIDTVGIEPTPILMRNNGILPVLNVTTGLTPIVLMPYAQLERRIPPQKDAVQSMNYPLLMPTELFMPIIHYSPTLTRLGFGLGVGYFIQRLIRGRRR